MPRQTGTTFQNNFTGGFVTQATALNFPENAAFEQDNVVFSERGIVSRRPGFDYENNYTLKTLSRSEKVQVTFHWKNVAGNGNTNLVVHQNGGILYFYNTSTNLSLSAGISANTVALSGFQSLGSTSANLDQNECQFSSGLGYLFVVHPYCDPFYVKYNSDGTFTSSIIDFVIRDVTGIAEAVLVDNRPSSLTDTHKYNLFNQGWDTAKIATMHTALSSTYPSNADVWWIYKDSTNVFSPSTTLASCSRGSTPAPQGFFRLSPWATARAATALIQAGITVTLGATDETSGVIRPSVTEFHAGRVWYTGVNAQGYNSRIYFSQIVQDLHDVGHCYADNDPTSETLSDFLPSDGGIISIPQAGTIFRLISLGPTLLVFGANGVWAISGSVGVGFTASDYSVLPVSFTRSISGTSFVVADNTVAWWNGTSINILMQDKNGLNVQSMSDQKIKDFYLSIDGTAKKFARGSYNPRTHTMQWLYRTASFASIDQTYTYDTVLSFNTLVGAFYTWSIPESSVSLNSIVVIEGSGSLTTQDTIVDNSAVTVVDNLGATLVTYGFSATTVQTTTKYLVYNGTKFTFAECFNVNYLDWIQAGVSVDYTSYFITGYTVKTQGQRRFQNNYIFIFSDMDEGNTSYFFQAFWDYATSGITGDWTQRQIIHIETNRDAARRRLKVRGSGNVVQFKFTSVTGLPFHIIGWGTADTANAAA